MNAINDFFQHWGWLFWVIGIFAFKKPFWIWFCGICLLLEICANIEILRTFGCIFSLVLGVIVMHRSSKYKTDPWRKNSRFE